MKKNILVTGGAGYIGSHVCKELSKAGYTPVTYDNLSTGNKHAVKWGDLVEADILDKASLKQAIEQYNIEAVIHLAAFIAVGESVENPGKYYRNNTVGGLTLLEAMDESGINKIVFSSTAAVYGIPKRVPIKENDDLKPINPYGHSKLFMEQMLADYKVARNIDSAILRYFNVAGADPDGEIGCEHKSPNNLIPIIMNVLSGKKEQLEIYGDDYDTEDGTAIRDYIHVSDLAYAHVLALGYLFNNNTCLTLNLGTGKGQSVQDVVKSTEKVSGKKVNVKNSPRRAGDPPKLFANASKANEILGWKAKYNDLDIITKTAWQWQLSL